MTIRTDRISIETQPGQMFNLTGRAQRLIDSSGCGDGTVTLFVAHTTAAIVISEYEPGLIHDLPRELTRLMPAGRDYRHDQINHDDNAHSHILGSLLGPSVTVPFVEGNLALGTWQQIVLIELDTHPRTRSVVMQVMGE